MTRRVAVCAVLVASLAACGGSDQADQGVSLRESCAEIEAAMPPPPGPGPRDAPSAAQWEQFSSDLTVIAEAGDTETKNAIEALQEAVEEKVRVTAWTPPYSPSEALDKIDAELARLDALDDLRLRCKAVGSSALQ